MSVDKDDRKRPHLQLVVNDADKRGGHAPRGEETFVSLNDLVAMGARCAPFLSWSSACICQGDETVGTIRG